MAPSQVGFLSVGCKRTDNVALKDPILRYVRNVYGEQQVEDVASDLDEVAQLRAGVVASSGGGSGDSAKDTLARYYRALCLMETRFPISHENGHVQVNFAWLDAIQPKKRTRQMNIHLEKAAVAFNLAAMYTQEAVLKDKNSTEGYKEAAQGFQEAAGVFQKTRDAATKISPCPTDLSNNTLSILEKLMLAQAQECAYNKASKDKKTVGVLARLAKQASILYSEVLGLMITPAFKDYFDKTWQVSIQMKTWLLDALCQKHAAQTVTEGKDIAVEIARLRQASELLQRIKKGAKGSSIDMSMVKSIEEVVNSRLTNAEKDNHSVYLMRVQPFGELPQIEGYQIVKPLQPSALESSQDHLFSTLIPESSAKALSRYSELLDDLVREQMSKLDGATDDARIKLKEWEMPELLDGVNRAPASMMPEGLGKDLDEIQHGGGIQYLQEVSDQVSALRGSIDEVLVQVETELDSEALKDAELREKHGEKWFPPPSSSLNGQFRQLISSYRSNLQAAEKSDLQVREKLIENTVVLSRLNRETVASQLPHLDAPIMNLGGTDAGTIVSNIQQALDQMNTVSADRAALEDSLRDRKQKDNILPKLMAGGAVNHEDLFRESLAAYEDLKTDIQENLDRQKQLLTYLGEAVRAFRDTFNVSDWKAKVDRYAGEMKEKTKIFLEVRDNLGEGMRFYTSLQDAVSILKQQVTDFSLTRRVQREDHIERAKDRGPRGLVAGALQGIGRLISHSQPGPPPTQPQPPQPPPMTPPPLQAPQMQYQMPPSMHAGNPGAQQHEVPYNIHGMSGELQTMAVQEGHQPSSIPQGPPQPQYAQHPQHPQHPQQPQQPQQPQHLQQPPGPQYPQHPPQHYQMQQPQQPQQQQQQQPGYMNQPPPGQYSTQYYGYQQTPPEQQPQQHMQHLQPMPPPDWRQQAQPQGYQQYQGGPPPPGGYYTNQPPGYPPQQQ